MNAVFFSPPDGRGHVPVPLAGSYANRDGRSANLLDSAQYPVFGTCKICRDPIWLEVMMQREWRHVPVPEPGNAS